MEQRVRRDEVDSMRDANWGVACVFSSAFAFTEVFHIYNTLF